MKFRPGRNMAVSKMATGTDHIWTKNVISEHDTQQVGGQTESKMAAGPPNHVWI